MKIKLKKITALLLALLLLAGADFSIAASAQSEIAASGQCGESVYWSFDSETGVLTVSGTGSMYDYDYDGSPFYADESIRQVVIESGVTHIGNNAFNCCLDLRTVRVMESSASVGEYAFLECLNMTDIYYNGTSSEYDDFYEKIQNGNTDFTGAEIHYLKELTENFYGPISYDIINNEVAITYCDTSLSGVYDIPSEINGLPVVKLSYSCFSYCEYITGINIPGSVKEVDSYAFDNCSGLKSVSFGEGVTEIGISAFSGCSGLESVSLPSTLRVIGNSVFSGCISLSSVSVSSDSQYFLTDSSGVLYTKDYSELIWYPVGKTDDAYAVSEKTKTIREYAFSNAENLRNVTADGSLEKICTYAFKNCYKLESVTVPDTVNEIGEYAFANTALTGIVAPKGITEIKDGTYYMCSKLKKVEIPDAVTVCDKAFSDVKPEEFIIGAGVLQSNDFSSFKTGKFTVSESNPYFSSDEQGVLFNKDKTVLIRYPVLSDISEYTIPDSVTEIGKNAFNSAAKLSVLIMPASTEKIGNTAFSYSKIIYIGYMGTQAEWDEIEIGKTAFMSGKDIEIFNEYGKISGSCGESLSWLYSESEDTLIISGSGEMDSNASFNNYGWYSFKDEIRLVDIADGVTSVGANAFAGCGNLNEVCLGKDVEIIGENAFADCTELTFAAIMSDSFTAENAFSNNSSNLSFVADKSNTAAADFAGANGANLITAEYSERDDGSKVLSFSGETVVYSDMPYSFIDIFIASYMSADYIHFDRLAFDGENAADYSISLDELDTQSAELAFTDLYVRIGDEPFSFGNVLKLLKEGNLDAFKLNAPAETKGAIAQFFDDVAEVIEKVYISALKLMSKVVNFVVKFFKK